MTRCLSLLLLVFGLVTMGAAQDTGENEATLKILEDELLARPVFDRAFYDVLMETLDESAWKNLDVRWQGLQTGDPRYQILRGMLAERQGDFDAALTHFEATEGIAWGAYHHARFLAFLGETEKAKGALLTMTQATNDPWLFREAARGLGELILLQEGVEAAERYYAALWEKHPSLTQRMPLLEPLLTLRMEMGRGASWLDSLAPPFDPQAAFSPSAAELDQGALWHWGRLLTRPQYQRRRPPVPPVVNDSVLYGDPLLTSARDEWLTAALKHPDCSRWETLLSLEQGYHSITKTPVVLAESMIKHQQTQEHTMEAALSLAANEGSEVFLQVATILKAPLREKPWLVARTALSKTDRVQAAHDRLEREVFSGTQDAAWKFVSLVLRSEAGVKPEKLRAEALALWRAVKPAQRLLVRASMLHAPRPGVNRSLLEGLVVNEQPGCWCPVSNVVWNLRGGSFIAVMRNRFAYENQKLFSQGTLARGFTNPFKLKNGRWYLGTLADMETGAQLRFALWLLRDQLGLATKDLGNPGEDGQDSTSRMQDMLTRGSLEEISHFLVKTPQLASLPAKWLLALRRTMILRSSQRDAPQATPEVFEAASAKVADALQAQRPGWFVTSLTEDRPLARTPTLDSGQRDDLLMACVNSASKGDAAQIISLQNWRKIIPEITDDASLQAELTDARSRLGNKSLPHALWGLQWQPSLRRQVALASPDYMEARLGGIYLNITLPRLMQNIAAGEISPPLSAEKTAAEEVSYKLLQLFGPALMKPQPGRIAEMRDQGSHHSRVRDLLAAWDIMQVPVPDLEPAEIFQHLHPLQHAGLLKVLEKSASADGKLAMAVMHQRHGDPEVAERLLAENHGAKGPLNMLAAIKEQKAASIPPAAPDTVDKAKKIFAEHKEPEPVKTLAWRVAKSMAERQLVYDWLRKEAKPEPAFARHIGVMAEFARMLKVPAAELAAAEELDLRFNKDDPLVWVKHAISHARDGRDARAVDLFLEAVRRTSFTNPPPFTWELAPPQPSWLERVEEAGRLGELAGALGDALKNNPPGSADDLAATVLEKVVDGGGSIARAQQVGELLTLVLERHRHLLMARYEVLAKEATDLEAMGEQTMATLLARMALQGVWPASMTKEIFHHRISINEVPSSVFEARAAWEDLEPTLKPERRPAISAVLDLALRGKDMAAFSMQLARDAAQFPEEEQIISCALQAQARLGPLPVEALKLTLKLDPLARMRAAWRLCALAPKENLPRQALTPMLAEGVKEMFHADKLPRDPNIRYRMAARVIPWLAKNEAADELRQLTRLLLQHANDDLWPRCWALIADTATKYGGPELALKATAQWWEHCSRSMDRQNQPLEWYVETMEDICLLVQDPHGTTPEVFADLATDVWKTAMQKFAAGNDPPSRMARLFGDALISTGRIEQLQELKTTVENILLLDGGEEYEFVRARLKEGLTLLGKDGGGLPSTRFWLVEGSENEARVTMAWQLAVPLKTAPDDWFITSNRPILDDGWVVPHFMKSGHDLEFLVGDSPEALRPLAKAPSGAKAGTMQLQNLPDAGWLCAVLRSSGTGAVNFGKPVMYCLKKPLMDSTALKRARPPRWEEAEVAQYGRPVSNLVPIQSGLQIIITDLSEAIASKERTDDGVTPQSRNVNLVGLDGNGSPVGVWPLTRDKMTLRPDGSRVSLVEPDHWTGSGGWLRPEQGDVPSGEMKPTHLVMTTFGPPDAPLRALRLQAFRRTDAPAESLENKVLAGRPVANTGFLITGSYLAERTPRAAFSGKGVMAVYDTSTTPWKELMLFEDAAISEEAGIFMMGPDVVCLMNTPQATPRATREIWQLRCDGRDNPVTLRECPKATLPFVPTRRERSPDEQSHLFISSPDKGQMQVAWLDNQHGMKTISIPAAAGVPTVPVIVWWLDSQTAVIKQGGSLYEVRRTDDELNLTLTEKDSLSQKLPPQGSTPGRQTQQHIWMLKRPRVLVRAVRQTGEIVSAHRLPEECVGDPMAWITQPNRSVLLQTSLHELISVMPETNKP